MGLYRFALAAIVVMFHFGDFPWLTGRVAVYGFYFVSGALITRVLDTHYIGSIAGMGRFYVNRALRLMPLLAVVVIATWTFVATWPPAEAPANRLPPGVSAADLTAGLRRVILPPVDARTFEGYPFVALEMPTRLIPPAWTIGVELLFYLVAPLVVLGLRRGRAALFMLFAISFGLFGWGFQVAAGRFDVIDDELYKNAVSSVAFFVAGAGAYVLSRRVSIRFRYQLTAATIAAFAVYLAMMSRDVPWSSYEPTASAYAIHMLAMIPLGTMVMLTDVPAPWRRFDRGAGNLSYGIYLFHYLANAVLIQLGVERFATVDQFAFGLYTLLLAIGCAAAGYVLIEAPVERWRARVRHAPIETTSAPPRRVIPATTRFNWAFAGLPVCMFLAATAVDAGYLTSKPAAVGIRWHADVDAAARQRVERRYSLECATRDENAPDGRTYTYCTWDTSLDTLRRIVQDPAVEDTNHIDRARFVIVD